MGYSLFGLWNQTPISQILLFITSDVCEDLRFAVCGIQKVKSREVYVALLFIL